MALVLADRVKETTTTTGTGTVTLGGAVTGYQSFASIGNANTTYYVIAGQGTAEWEVGIGTYTSSGTTLSRTTVLASSNAGSLVSFSAGTKDVFVTYPASQSVYGNGTVLSTPANAILSGTNGGTGVNNGSNTITVGGNVNYSGAFTQTWTRTANTSLTLPTSGTVISTVTNMAANPVTGTPSSSNFLRGDGTWATPTAGAAGSNTQVQYNNSGALAGSASLTFNSGTGALSATSFSGAGTGLTGTASSLSIGGTATTATTANALNTGNNYQVNSLGVGTSSTTAGQIKSTTAIITPGTAGVSTGLNVVNGDITTYRTGGTSGVVYLSSSGADYLYHAGGGTYYLGANVAMTSASKQVAKAWAYFDSGTTVIYNSHNVSSITYGAAGYFIMNFITSLGTANYSAVGSCGSNTFSAVSYVMSIPSNAAQTATYVPMQCYQSHTLAAANPPAVSVVVFA